MGGTDQAFSTQRSNRAISGSLQDNELIAARLQLLPEFVDIRGPLDVR
jgi:hypothetical protein